MQTILGAGGAVGNELAKVLTAYSKEIRLVSRKPLKVNETDELFAADLTVYEQVQQAVNGSEVVYLTVGLQYNTKVWQQTWPVIMENVIRACIESKSRLVFFDNVYMYDGNSLDPITEESKINPSSGKGKVRAQVAAMLWEAVKSRGLIALIARSADFYGPGVKNVSVLIETVFNPLSKNSKANWLADDTRKHSYTYIADAAKATALLGNTVTAFGETWHLPTAKNPLTGKEWVSMVAKELGTTPRHRVVGKTMVQLMGIFIPAMRETVEMLYQYDRNYVFNSDKFERSFSFTPIPYMDGVKEIVKADYSKKQAQ